VLKTLLLALALPPVNLALLAALGLLLHRTVVTAVGVCGLLVLAVPAVADSLMAALDVTASRHTAPPQAIVVLSAETERDAAPPHATLPGLLTLERLRSGVALARRTGLPLLVTGGVVEPHSEPAAIVMAQSLREDFQLPARWVEDRAATTWQNATRSAALLKPDGVRVIYLVTDGWHMRRALIAFHAAGLQAIPAPVLRDGWPLGRLADFVPQAGAWHTSYYAIHEWIGCALYWARERWGRA
jgi:uncharacterized SAM-binding protein YcdF (DUF218 family)